MDPKPAVLVVRDSSKDAKRVVARLQTDGNLTSITDLNLDRLDTIDDMIDRENPDYVLLSIKDIESARMVYSHIVAYVNESPLRPMMIVPGGFVDEDVVVDNKDGYLTDVTNADEVSTDIKWEWQRADSRPMHFSGRHTDPKLVVVAGSFAAGKTTIVNRALKYQRPRRGITKWKEGDLRSSEIEGRDYHTRARRDIEAADRKGTIIPYFVNGRAMGIPKYPIQMAYERGEDAFLVVGDTDVIKRLRKEYGSRVRTVLIYSKPELLEQRLARDTLEGLRDESELKTRLDKIKNSYANFMENADIFDYFIPNFNPPRLGRDSDKIFWDEKEVARAASWLDRIFQWEYDNESVGVPQLRYEQGYVRALVKSIFGDDIEAVIERVERGTEVRPIQNGMLHSFVNDLTDNLGQSITYELIKQITGRPIKHISHRKTLSIYLDRFIEFDHGGVDLSDKQISMMYLQQLAGQPIYKNPNLDMTDFSAYGKEKLWIGGEIAQVSDGLLWGLSLPPSEVNQEGEARRLAISYLAQNVDSYPEKLCSVPLSSVQLDRLRFLEEQRLANLRLL